MILNSAGRAKLIAYHNIDYAIKFQDTVPRESVDCCFHDGGLRGAKYNLTRLLRQLNFVLLVDVADTS
ncbi:hypothetical protein BJG93_35490 [Paraburkholderia sprentiae WSM5005]|uniref:Uncharacterized protein n=1 Tax=Paraburkholderia sprentiae WSM5005 TaxID=754502 RepID=A0A8F4KHD9_9BURK|nr:hypothetical protein [Paraburkholderia sprentiae]QXE07149.1 hypothetical protein BJG93_35490 [Paraburkholderia sprentiae WSM5005]